MSDGMITQPSYPLYRGVDLAIERRPGVPKESAPHPLPGAHWREPERQRATVPLVLREGLDRPTPVFGTAQPERGLSGAIRRAAYESPDHRLRHWALLFVADRVDVVEHLAPLRWLEGMLGGRSPGQRRR